MQLMNKDLWQDQLQIEPGKRQLQIELRRKRPTKREHFSSFVILGLRWCQFSPLNPNDK